MIEFWGIVRESVISMTVNTEAEVKDFNENVNISFIPDKENVTVDNNLIWKHYLSSLLVYGLCVFAYTINPFFSGLLSDEVKVFYLVLYLLYSAIAPFIYFTVRPKSIIVSHNIAIFDYLKRVAFKVLSKQAMDEGLSFYKPTYYQLQSIVLIFIKFFFGALMLQGFYKNMLFFNNQSTVYSSIISDLSLSVHQGFGAVSQVLCTYNLTLFKFLVVLCFTIDLSYFVVGYLTELNFLNNKIRSVDTTPAGLFFCLMCYPPFFLATHSFTGEHTNMYSAAFGDENSILTWIFRGLAFVFIIIYVAATVALGPKGSNLTNRGTVSCFPYNIVRHPAYISKNLFWIITFIPVFLVNFNDSSFELVPYLLKIFGAIFVCLIYVLIYYFRAMTEERHMMKDPEYREYAKKVKYRFIPGVI